MVTGESLAGLTGRSWCWPSVGWLMFVATPLCRFAHVLSARSVSGQTLTDRLFSSLSGGELFERITAEGYTMSEAEVINYMRQICEGVKHMHERNIIHLGESPSILYIIK